MMTCSGQGSHAAAPPFQTPCSTAMGFWEGKGVEGGAARQRLKGPEPPILGAGWRGASEAYQSPIVELIGRSRNVMPQSPFGAGLHDRNTTNL
jgi:hypothetical protein